MGWRKRDIFFRVKIHSRLPCLERLAGMALSRAFAPQACTSACGDRSFRLWRKLLPAAASPSHGKVRGLPSMLSLSVFVPEQQAHGRVTPHCSRWRRISTFLNARPLHGTASIDASARVHEAAYIGAHTVILAGVEIEEGATIESHCVIGPDVVVGRNSRILSHASLSHCTLSNDVVLWNGVRVGQDGFGFHPATKQADANADADAEAGVDLQQVAKKPQVGAFHGHSLLCVS